MTLYASRYLFMVFYRKYRPQKISELDLPDVREKLTSILSSKNLPHAFLFTGSKGLGKTSAARILAKAINCTSTSAHPCNQCDNCISITNGSNIDVLEIDAASNGGVEEIRSLRERVKFASSSLKYKVYIIDEVHMLSTGAFNALLKTLEEPPSHVIFVLATTELWKLPPTVVSRTFQIQFEKPTDEQIAASLERVIKGEKLDVQKGVLERIAQISDGAFRDATKNLEQLVLNSNGKKITQELFDATFKMGGLKDLVDELLIALSQKDGKKGLEIIEVLSSNGSDFKVVIEALVDRLRAQLMLKNGIEAEGQSIEQLTIEDINELLKLSNEAYGELKLSVIPSLPLELLVVGYCILGKESEQVSVPIIASEAKQSPQQQPKNLLANLITELNITNKPGAALLRSAREASVENEVMTIITPFPIHADRLKSEKVLPDLLKAAENVANTKVEVKILVENN